MYSETAHAWGRVVGASKRGWGGRLQAFEDAFSSLPAGLGSEGHFVRFIFLAVALAGGTLAGWAQTTTPRITAAVDEGAVTALRGNTHPLARPQFDRGAAPAELPMNRMLLVLKRSPEQETTLQELLDQQHDKSSPNYHRWLTPDQFGQQFGPADQDIQAIRAWLESNGFRVARVAKGRTAIEFSGTAGQVQQAFGTQIHRYLAGGTQFWANGGNPQIPSALGPVVSGLAGLHNFPVKPLHHVAGAFTKSAVTSEIRPLLAPGNSGLASNPGSSAGVKGQPSSAGLGPQFTFSNGNCNPSCWAIGPYDFATIYNLLPLWNGNPAINGTGQSIAIVAESNINLQDVENFRSMFGLPANDPTVIVDGPDPGITLDGDETEALLDTEWSGAVAPGANIDLITSASTNTTAGVDLSALYAVDNNVAPVLSVSFGQCELFLGSGGNQFYSALWEQAAAEGITVVVAAGDSGSAGCDFDGGLIPEAATEGLEVSGLASTPFNVAVGGTDFMNFGADFSVNSPSPYWNTTNNPQHASALRYIPESTWNSSCTNEGIGLIGFESTAEARCNDSLLIPLVQTIAGGGGKSNCIAPAGMAPSGCGGGYPQPAWQGSVSKDLARDLPDLSLFASNGFWNSFYIMCEADALPLMPSCNLSNGFANFLGVGGTSASTPAFAGIMALVNQYTSSTGQGNANYVLYRLPSLPSQNGLNCNSTTGPAPGCIFNDVTFGTIAMPCAIATPNCTLSNPGDTYGVLSGYDAGTGYDLATGLGSVNADNLVRSWSQAMFKATSTTLTLNGANSGPVTLTHGQSVPVVVNVKSTSGSGTPTGDVSLIANSINGEGVDGNTLNSNGTASWNTSRLPGGSYNVTAHYAGDGTFGGSNSAPFAVNVTPESSTTTLSGLMASAAGSFFPLPQSVSYGTTVYLRADVKSATQSNSETPATGTVTFTDSYAGGGGSGPGPGTVPNVPYALSSTGSAIAANGLCALFLGTHSVTANYSGDNSYQSSSTAGPPISFTVSPAIPQVSVLPPLVALPFNSTATLELTVGLNPGINPLTGTYCSTASPTGAVSLFYGTDELGTSLPLQGSLISTAPQGQASALIHFSTSGLPIGKDAVTLKYSGDANYSNTSQTVTAQVGYPTSTAVTSSNATVALGMPVTFTAQVTTSQAGGPPISGSVLFRTGINGGTPVPLVNGTAQFTTTFTSAFPPSQVAIASYSGDTNYIPSEGFVTETVVVLPDFTLSDSLGNIVIAAPGASSGPVTLTIAGVNGYAGTILFSANSCSITPAGSLSTCSFSPSSITGSGSTQLVINTTGPRASGAPGGRWDPGSFGLDERMRQAIFIGALFLLAVLVSRKRRRFSLAFGSVILMALFALWACGGSTSGTGDGTSANVIAGTPTGVPYTVTINASAPGVSSHTLNVTFVVQ